MALKKICQAPGCNCLVGPGERFCPRHQPQEKERKPFVGWMSDQQKAFYNSRRWRSLKSDVLKENPVCQMCGKAPSEEIHHDYDEGVDFHNPDMFFDRDHLVALCRECHQRITRDRMMRRRRQSARNRRERKLWY